MFLNDAYKSLITIKIKAEKSALKNNPFSPKMKNEKGINWGDFDDGVKYGRFIYKVKIVTEIPQLNETTERYAWHIRNAFKITDNKERFNELNIIPKME